MRKCHLIRNEADVKLKDNQGRTALMHAVLNDNHFMAECLIAKGADAFIEDNNGKNALAYAKKNRNRVIVSMLKFVMGL